MDHSPKEKEIEAKINKWDLNKLKTFAQQRKPSIKLKDNLLNANDITHKGLISKIYKQLIQLSIKKNGKKKLGWIFFQRRHTDGQQAYNKCL